MSSITILGKRWDVVFFEDNDLSGNMGACNRGKMKISLCRGLNIDQLGDTILHEVIHAVNEELALDLPEQKIAQIATGLYSAGVRVTGITEEL